jgi:hypothetical protein
MANSATGLVHARAGSLTLMLGRADSRGLALNLPAAPGRRRRRPPCSRISLTWTRWLSRSRSWAFTFCQVAKEREEGEHELLAKRAADRASTVS